jgi:hypothetical protein
MSKELPAGLVPIADKVGFQWPKADEDVILKHARGWHSMQQLLSAREYPDVWRMYEGNDGEAIDAFRAFWLRRSAQERDVAKAAGIVAGALTTHATAITNLKTFAITQLTMLKDFLDRFNWPSWIGGPDADEVAWQNDQAIARVREALQAHRQTAIDLVTQAAAALTAAEKPFHLGEISRDFTNLAETVSPGSLNPSPADRSA